MYDVNNYIIIIHIMITVTTSIRVMSVCEK